MPLDAFTISSNNYLGMTRVFADSYIEHHPGSRVFVCLVDRLDDRVPYGDFPFEIILAEDLEIPRFSSFSFRYDILELNTAVKPFVFKYLRDVVGLDRVFYFDPDILVRDRLSGLEEALAAHQAVLTPHLTEPLDNRCRPPERVIGMCGVYNLGFVGLQLNEGTRSFIDWWCDRLHRYCIVDLPNGMFVDQSWMDFAPAYLDSVAIARDPIYNIAYWNLPHRHPVEVDDHWEIAGRRVGFFHFSGVDLENLDVISRHQDRVDLWKRPELRPLFENYRELVQRSGQQEVREIPYHFGTFSGTEIAIPWVARIALQEVDPNGLRWPDPFAVDSDDSFLAWLAEPLEFRGQTVNRTALYLWQERPDVKLEFPDINGRDLTRFLEWYFAKGISEESLHDVFVEALRTAPPTMSSYRFLAEIDEVGQIDLSNPKERTAWLNEPVDDVAEPLLTRLSMAIHRTSPDVAARYPEPLGRHRQEYAYWMVLEGGPSYALHPDLLEPIRCSLSARSKISARFRRSTSRLRDAMASRSRPSPPNPTRTIEGPKVASAERRFPEELLRFLGPESSLGVNLVGVFDGPEGARSFAPWIREALTACDVPHVVVPLDHELPDGETSNRIRHKKGAPFPVTLLATPPARWSQVLRKMPIGSRLGTRVVGYCAEMWEQDAVHLAPEVDEVWTPSLWLTEGLARRVQVPVRTMPPGARNPSTSGDLSAQAGNRERLTFLVVECGSGAEEQRAVSEAIECFRKMKAVGNSEVGLRLAVGPDKAGLKAQLRHLPIEVVSETLTYRVLDRVIFGCDGFLDLNPTPRLLPIHLKAAKRGLPMILGWGEAFRESGPVEIDRVNVVADRGEGEGSIEFGIAALLKVSAQLGGDGIEKRSLDGAADSTRTISPLSDVSWRAEIKRLVREKRGPLGGCAEPVGAVRAGQAGMESGQ